jgi:hypothetical protein
MEVGKSQNLFIFWLPIGTNNKICRLVDFFFLKSGEFWPFFSWKILPIG